MTAAADPDLLYEEESVLKRLSRLDAGERERLIAEFAKDAGLSVAEMKAVLITDWQFVGRPKQQPPEGQWTYWMIRTGRGWGKTQTLAHWAKDLALSDAGCRIALVGPTFADGRDTMVEGETGLLNVLPAEALLGQSRDDAWNRSIGELVLANETRLRVFSSERPNRLRGPQHHYAWCTEISSWKDAARGDVVDTTWSNVKLSTRLGDNPQIAIDSTPKPNKLTKEVLAIPGLRLVTGSSYENRDNLSEEWWAEIVAPLEGSRTGRQEIHGELLEDVEGALWTVATLEACRVAAAPALTRIVVAVDPNVSSSEAANAAGIIVAGVGMDNHGYVIADRTTTRGGPRAWAQAAVDAYHDFSADRIVGEINNGGEMVELTILGVDSTVAYKPVQASRGKRTRAEPVAALYEADEEHNKVARAHHVGVYPELEEEMTTWTPDAESPNRMDALVWAMTELKLWRPTGTMRTYVPKGRIPRPGDGPNRLR